MEHVLITGARGFTARYLAKKLRDYGHRVSATTLSVGDAKKLSCYDQVVGCDIRDRQSILQVLNLIKPDRIVHLSGLSFVGHEDVIEFYRVNAIGADNLLWAIEESGLPVKSIVLASSANVYGVPEVNVIDESVAPKPVNHYAISKLNMEYLAQTYIPRLPIIITRPFNYVGFGQNENFVIPKIVKAFASSEKELYLGNIHISRDFTAIQDTVDAYCKLLFSTTAFGETFNICSGKATNLSSIIDMLTEISSHNIEVKVNQDFIRKNEIISLVGLNSKLMSYTDWKINISLNDVLQEMYEKYKAIN